MRLRNIAIRKEVKIQWTLDFIEGKQLRWWRQQKKRKRCLQEKHETVSWRKLYEKEEKRGRMLTNWLGTRRNVQDS